VHYYRVRDMALCGGMIYRSVHYTKFSPYNSGCVITPIQIAITRLSRNFRYDLTLPKIYEGGRA